MSENKPDGYTVNCSPDMADVLQRLFDKTGALEIAMFNLAVGLSRLPNGPVQKSDLVDLLYASWRTCPANQFLETLACAAGGEYSGDAAAERSRPTLTIVSSNDPDPQPDNVA